MKKIVIELSVEDDDFVETVDLVTRSLFDGNPWLPGFLFQDRIKGFGINFEQMREANYG